MKDYFNEHKKDSELKRLEEIIKDEDFYLMQGTIKLGFIVCVKEKYLTKATMMENFEEIFPKQYWKHFINSKLVYCPKGKEDELFITSDFYNKNRIIDLMIFFMEQITTWMDNGDATVIPRTEYMAGDENTCYHRCTKCGSVIILKDNDPLINFPAICSHCVPKVTRTWDCISPEHPQYQDYVQMINKLIQFDRRWTFCLFNKIYPYRIWRRIVNQFYVITHIKEAREANRILK
jgi:hypothetical protein